MAARNHGESVRLALDTLRQHKLRSFLTVLGVVMGVGVLMLVAALITGFDATSPSRSKTAWLWPNPAHPSCKSRPGFRNGSSRTDCATWAAKSPAWIFAA